MPELRAASAAPWSLMSMLEIWLRYESALTGDLMEKVGKIAELSILVSLCVYIEKLVRMA